MIGSEVCGIARFMGDSSENYTQCLTNRIKRRILLYILLLMYYVVAKPFPKDRCPKRCPHFRFCDFQRRQCIAEVPPLDTLPCHQSTIQAWTQSFGLGQEPVPSVDFLLSAAYFS